MTEKTKKVNGQVITLSSVDKVLFPEEGITKGELVDYYQRIAEYMLPYLRDRPVTMERYPDGLDGTGFYQKEVPDYFPGWIERVTIHVEETATDQEQVVCTNTATLVFLGNQACITPHIWLSRKDRLDYPDKLIFDLDPAQNDFASVRQAARDLHTLLNEVNLISFVMTTGSRGLHVVVPLDRHADFDEVRDFAHKLADVLAKRHPERLTTAQRKQKREGRLFLDYLRNAYAQNSVTPYAVRALPGAPVATPLDWHELHDPDLHAQRYTVANIFRRLGQKEDPWREMMNHAQSLKEPRKNLAEYI